MGAKAEHRAAQALVATYYEARLAELLEHVGEALDAYRGGDLDAFAVDEVIHRYSKATRELWKFCWIGGSGAALEVVARSLERMTSEGEQIDWWEKAAPSRGRRG
jgi:hypothetical protein